MILILSRKVAETSTNKVIDYLENSGASFFRFNGDDLFNEKTKVNFFFDKDNAKWSFEIISNDKKISSDVISVVWYRRDFFDELDNLSDDLIINNFLKGEVRKTYDLLYMSLRNKIWINKPNEITNKLYVVEQAHKVGLNIPESFVTNNVSFLSYLNSNFQLITKPINEGFGIVKNNERLTTFTSILDLNKIIEEVDDFIFPSLFQSMIEKEYEIRTFYLFKKCYSIAIFSQNDEKTKVDFRDYNLEKPNRMSRYRLPSEIVFKIKTLMNNLDMNSGSIDLIRNKEGDYYFLEINPVGQFDFIEVNGNYNLSEIVANKLIDIDEKRKE
jgi:ATP-GRASP peptide maturase of grasp-with-spasm system